MLSGRCTDNVNPGPVMTDMWDKIWNTLPEYAKPIYASMGATDAVSFANLSNQVYMNPENTSGGLLYAADIAKVVLAFANGTTQYNPGDGVCTYPGCTYMVADLYDGIYGGTYSREHILYQLTPVLWSIGTCSLNSAIIYSKKKLKMIQNRYGSADGGPDLPQVKDEGPHGEHPLPGGGKKSSPKSSPDPHIYTSST